MNAFQSLLDIVRCRDVLIATAVRYRSQRHRAQRTIDRRGFVCLFALEHFDFVGDGLDILVHVERTKEIVHFDDVAGI